MGICSVKSSSQANQAEQAPLSSPIGTNLTVPIDFPTPRPLTQTDIGKQKVQMIQTMNIYKIYSILHQKDVLKDHLGSFIQVQHNLTGLVSWAQVIPLTNQLGMQYVDCIRQHKLVFILYKQKCHQNIVQISEIFQDAEHIQILQECFSGSTLEEYVEINTSLPELKVRQIMKQVMAAVAHIHALGFVHGRLSLSSFQFMDQSQNFIVKLTDIQNIFIKPEITVHQAQYMSPETCMKEQTQASDLWACGILAYHMLTGTAPFHSIRAQSVEQLQRRIIRGGLNFELMQFDKVSSQGINFLKELLNVDLKLRLTMPQCLAHDWFKIKTKDTNYAESYGKLDYKCKITRTQSYILLQMIKCFNAAQQQFLCDQFSEVDKNMDGKLDKAEIQETFQKFGVDISHINEIFDYIDQDKSGQIDLDEFVIAMADRKSLITRDNLLITFQLLDLRRCGKIPTTYLSEKIHIDENLIHQDLRNILGPNKQYNFLTYMQFCELMFKLI